MSELGDVQELFKRAAAIAAVVPEPMQEAAFNRALDLLTGGGGGNKTDREAAPRTTKKAATAKRTSASAEAGGGSSAVDRVALVSAIPRNEASEVDQETSVQGRSIALLVAAHREAKVDGLTAPEIAKILTEKFRHKTSRQAVGQALDSAGSMVDRLKSGNGAALFRVMKAGEDWLATPADQRPKANGATPRRRSGAKKKVAATKASDVTVGSEKPVKAASQKRASAKKAARAASGAGRAGPKAALETLIGEGFFTTGRTMGDIKTELRDRKALTFSSNDLSPALIRLLREQKLRRSKTEKQYAYTTV